MMQAAGETGIRIDKWLWAARFFKSRSLATEAVEGGKVHLNDVRIKPAKEVKLGDRLQITIGETRWIVVVRGVSARRGPATEAQQLYEETSDSQAARAALREQRMLLSSPGTDAPGRPTKRDRRRIDHLRRSG